MTNPKRIKVIFDTNIWISFLIGKRLQSIKNLIVDRQIQIILTPQLLLELRRTAQKPKLVKFFAPDKVDELISFLNIVGETYTFRPKNIFKRDPKDSFLLDLAEKSKANYLVTGDNDLLELKKFKTTIIISPAAFEKELNNIRTL